MELNIKKRFAKDILNSSVVAHDDLYTYNIINSNILVNEIVECIYDRQVENPVEDHIYNIIINSSLYTLSINIGVAGTRVSDCENVIIETFGDLLSASESWVSELGSNTYESMNSLLLSLFKDGEQFSLGVCIHKPMYCNIEPSM